MKKTSSITTLLIVGLILLTAGFVCNNSEDSSTPTNKPVANTPANSADSNSKPTTDSAAPQDISGSYTATGGNEDGGGNYEADLVVTNRDDVYQFSWESAGRKYDGVGVQTGNKVAVSFAAGADGKGCGVVLYGINPDGSLDGKAGYWGTNIMETETAKRTDGNKFEENYDLAGRYDVEGKNPNGEIYKSKLDVSERGDGYEFLWSGAVEMKGFGIRQRNTVSVGIGGTKCSFVAYEVKPDGTLDGKWGGQSSFSFGTEIAKKK